MEIKTGESIFLDVHETNYIKSKHTTNVEREENKFYKEKEWVSKDDYDLDAAFQQLTGYNQANKGFSLLELVSSMGLTLEEWNKIKKEYVNVVQPNEVKEIDEYFLE